MLTKLGEEEGPLLQLEQEGTEVAEDVISHEDNFVLHKEEVLVPSARDASICPSSSAQLFTSSTHQGTVQERQ